MTDYLTDWVIEMREFGRRMDPETGEQWPGRHEWTLKQPGGIVRGHSSDVSGLKKMMDRFASLRPSEDTTVIYKMEHFEGRRMTVVYDEEFEDHTWGPDPVE